jgi:phage shock protein PspC (stress-responsive transcriptional regulator)
MSPADEIAKLHELLVSGRLTQAEFEQGKAQILGSNPYSGTSPAPVGSRLRRSSSDYWLGGVCGGLGKASGIESWIWRLLFACSILLGGIGVIPYILLWIFVPLDTSGH